MAAIDHDFTIEQGASWIRRIQLRDDDNNIILTTGWRGRMQVRSPIESTTVLLELSTENGRITNAATKGEFTLTLTPSETLAYSTKDAVYDFIVVDTSGVVRRILQGAFEMSPTVTRYQLYLSEDIAFGDALANVYTPA